MFICLYTDKQINTKSQIQSLLFSLFLYNIPIDVIHYVLINSQSGYMSNKIRPQTACKRFTLKKLGKNEYWSPNLFKGNNPYEYGKKIDTKDVEEVVG